MFAQSGRSDCRSARTLSTVQPRWPLYKYYIRSCYRSVMSFNTLSAIRGKWHVRDHTHQGQFWGATRVTPSCLLLPRGRFHGRMELTKRRIVHEVHPAQRVVDWAPSLARRLHVVRLKGSDISQPPPRRGSLNSGAVPGETDLRLVPGRSTERRLSLNLRCGRVCHRPGEHLLERMQACHQGLDTSKGRTSLRLPRIKPRLRVFLKP